EHAHYGGSRALTGSPDWCRPPGAKLRSCPTRRSRIRPPEYVIPAAVTTGVPIQDSRRRDEFLSSAGSKADGASGRRIRRQQLSTAIKLSIARLGRRQNRRLRPESSRRRYRDHEQRLREPKLFPRDGHAARPGPLLRHARQPTISTSRNRRRGTRRAFLA